MFAGDYSLALADGATPEFAALDESFHVAHIAPQVECDLGFRIVLRKP